MRYEEPRSISREDALVDLTHADPAVVAETLVRLALHDPGYSFVEQKCLDLLAHGEPNVRRVAAICLGHLARLHRRTTEATLTALRSLQDDPAVGGSATDALSDIAMFATE